MFLKRLLSNLSPREKFRVRKVTLKNGTTYFFPEYKAPGFLGNYYTIIEVNSLHYKLSKSSAINDPEDALPTETQAKQHISAYKRKLDLLTAEEVGSDVEVYEE